MKFDVVAINVDEGTLGQIAYDNTMKALHALEDDGQLDRMQLDGTVLIKPNFAQPPNPSLKFGPRESDMTVHNHVCTNPFAIKAACDFVQRHDGKALVAEGTKWPGGTRGVFLQTGCEPLLEGTGVAMLDTLTEKPGQRIAVSPSVVWNEDFREVEVSRIFEGVDVLLNVAKLKCHSNALVTGTVKNTYGCLEPAERRAEGHYCADPLWARISRAKMALGYKRLSETFVQVHDALVKGLGIDEICVVEGIIAGEGDGPLFRPATPRRENVVLASANSPATLDAAESYYMGYSPEFLRSFAEYTLHDLQYTPGDELLDSYADQYFLTLAESAGLGVARGFSVYAITPNASEVIPCEMLGLMRGGDVFALPTFVRYAANTPLFDQIPDGGYEFKVETPA